MFNSFFLLKGGGLVGFYVGWGLQKICLQSEEGGWLKKSVRVATQNMAILPFSAMSVSNEGIYDSDLIEDQGSRVEFNKTFTIVIHKCIYCFRG